MPTLTLLSDTHGQHRSLSLSETDWVVHAGDFSRKGKPEEVKDFLDWFQDLPHRVKILIAGNHDFLAEQDPERFRKMIPEGVIYLENEGREIEGLKVWGSPITPFFFNWAFNRQRGEDIARYWAHIPMGLDLLITHGPPFGLGDRTVHGEQVGCKDLLRKVLAVRPRYHLFGHIHEAYGLYEQEGITFINASVLDVRYQLAHEVVVIDH